jgi:hypothetical protein
MSSAVPETAATASNSEPQGCPWLRSDQ